MLHYILKDQNLLSRAMSILILQVILIKENLLLTLPTTEVEYMVATKACKEAIWIRG